MPHFFVQKENIGEKVISITSQDAVHIGRSLRMRLGDIVTICCQGEEYECKILSISDSLVECTIISHKKSENEPDVYLTLYQAVPKFDKLEFIVQKAVELGVGRICPVITQRCVSRPDEKSFEKKRQRLNRIALEAAKQCTRANVPQVSRLMTFEQCLESLKDNDVSLVCYEKGGENLNQIFTKNSKVNSVGVLVGSEGGFTQEEAEKCISLGVKPVWLGRRILRCETAPIAVISIIMNLTGNM